MSEDRVPGRLAAPGGVAHLFKGGELELHLNSRPPRLKTWATRPGGAFSDTSAPHIEWQDALRSPLVCIWLAIVGRMTRYHNRHATKVTMTDTDARKERARRLESNWALLFLRFVAAGHGQPAQPIIYACAVSYS